LGPLRTNTHTVKGLVAGWYAGDELARKSGAPAGGSRLYISRGLGMNWIPLRIGSPPELAMFSLRSKAGG
jgi:predicted MPP superfamily phosphohydrolase